MVRMLQRLSPWTTLALQARALIVALFVVMFCAVPVFLYAQDRVAAMVWLTGEDGPVESIVHTAVILSSLLLFLSAFLVLRGNLSTRHKRMGLGLLLLGVLLLGMYAEEISWGQRFLGLETPSWIASVNYQQEINLHNIYALESFLILMYFHGSLVFLSLFPALAAVSPSVRSWLRRWGIIRAPMFVAWGFMVLVFLAWVGGWVLSATTNDICLELTFRETVEALSELFWFCYAWHCFRLVRRRFPSPEPAARVGFVAVAGLLLCAVTVLQFRQFWEFRRSFSSDLVAEAYFASALQLRDEQPEKWPLLADIALEKAVDLGSKHQELPGLYVEHQFALIPLELERGRPDVAILRYNAILKFEGNADLEPQIVEALCGQARLLVDRGQYDLALNRANRALEYDALRDEAYLARGLALVLSGRVLEGQPDIERIMKKNPASKTQLQLFLVRGLLMIDEIDMAEAQLAEVLQKSPSLEEAQQLRQLCEEHRLFKGKAGSESLLGK